MNLRLIVLAVICAAGVIKSEEFDYSGCKRVVARVVKRQLATISDCINTMEFKNKKERAAKLPCILKCTAIKEKLLGPSGEISRKTGEEFIQDLPPFMNQRATKMLEDCINMATGEKAPDVEEEYCRTYTPYIKCFMDGTTKMCAEPKKDVKKDGKKDGKKDAKKEKSH